MIDFRRISRRRAIELAGSSLGLAVLPKLLRVIAAKAAEGLEEPKIEIAAVRDPQLGAQVAIAEEFGYFKDEGLDATVHWSQSGADVITVMAGGSQYIGTGGVFAEVVFGGQDLPIKIIAALADIAETQGFVLSPGVKLSSPRELEGKFAFVGDWAVSINRAGRRATPEEAFAPELLRSLDPSLVSWTTSKAEK